MSLTDCLGGLAGKLAQRHPGHIATGEVVARGPNLAARALFGARELFKTGVKLLDLPAHLHDIDDPLAGQVCGQVGGNDPFNVAVRGH